MRKELEPMEQAFLLLKNQNERWDEIIREYNERKFDELLAGFHQRNTPNKSLRLTSAQNSSKYHPSQKLHLARKLIDPFGENTGFRDENLRLNRGEELPLETQLTREPLGGRFVFPAHARALMATQGRPTIDVPSSKRNAALNLYGFEGTPERYGKNQDPEGIIYGNLEQDSVHRLNKKPFILRDLQRAAGMFQPSYNAPSKVGDDGAERYRARELAQMLMDAEIPGALIDPETARAHGIESFEDMTPKNKMGDITQIVNDLTGNIPMPTDRANPPLHGTFQQWERSMGPSGRVAELDETHTSPEQMQLLDDQLTAIPGAIMANPTQFYRSEPMDLAMQLLKAYLPTLQERGRKIDDQVSLRWIPRYHESTFHAPVPFHSSRGNVNWEQRLQNEKLKAPKDSAHSQRKTLPGVFEGDSKTPSNKPITGSWVAPATQQGAMGADVSFNDKGLLMAINENPDWWRTVQEGAAQESPGGEGFKYGGFDKEAFSKIPTPNISPISMLHYQMALENPMLQEDEVAQHFPDEHELITQFPNIKTEDIWGPSADLTINPVKVASEPMDIAMRLLKEDKTPDFSDEPVNQCEMCKEYLDDSDYHVLNDHNYCSDCYNQLAEPEDFDPDFQNVMTGEPMDLAMRLLKRDEIYDPNAENKGQEGVDWHPGEEGVDWDSAVSSSLHPSHDLTQRHPFDYDMHEYDHHAQKLLNLMRNRDVAHLQNNENPMTEDEQFDLMDARQKLQASIPKNTHFPSIQNAVGYDKDGNKISTFGDGRPKFNEGSPRYQELIGDRPTVPIHTEGSFYGVPFNEETGFTRSEPMEIAMRLLKERVSPEAKRHKLEYDKKYESSPERVKYREDLNRERRRRHIMGQGGPDMSHTSQHTIVPEDPHTNRARHFKDKGTLL